MNRVQSRRGFGNQAFLAGGVPADLSETPLTGEATMDAADRQEIFEKALDQSFNKVRLVVLTEPPHARYDDIASIESERAEEGDEHAELERHTE